MRRGGKNPPQWGRELYVVPSQSNRYGEEHRKVCNVDNRGCTDCKTSEHHTPLDVALGRVYVTLSRATEVFLNWRTAGMPASAI